VKRARRSIAKRDQRASVFGAALMRLCDATGARGAALVDAEGETVDYAGAIDPFDIKIAAAEWVIVLEALRISRTPVVRAVDQIIVRGTKKSYLVEVLEEGYALVVELLPHAFGASRRALAEAHRELSKESGLALPRWMKADRERWFRVDVRCEAGDARRPRALWMDGAWCTIEILGRWSGAAGSRDRGFRVRLPSGAEMTLAREPLGRWYVEAEAAP
jgi:hypothetical protein